MKKGRDILSGYGNDSSSPKRPRATSGGMTMKDKCDVMGYRTPWGPTNINDPKGPGIHGDNYGIYNAPYRSTRERGMPGLGGDSPRRKGSQRAK